MADAIQGLPAHFQEKGKRAFLMGETRDSHGLHPRATALADFYIGYDAAAKTHSGTAARARVDAAQVAA